MTSTYIISKFNALNNELYIVLYWTVYTIYSVTLRGKISGEPKCRHTGGRIGETEKQSSTQMKR